MSRGALPTFLDYIDLPGQAVRNTLAGRGSAAGRKALDFVLGPAHLLTGGDSLIPYASKPEDEISGGDLVGVTEPGLGKLAADIGVGVLTDPLSLLSFGAGTGVKVLGKTIAGAGKTLDPLTLSLKAASGVADKGIDLADQFVGKSGHSSITKTPIRDLATRVGAGARSTLGWQQVEPWAQTVMDRAAGTGNIASKAGSAEVERIFKNITPEEETALSEFAHQVHVDKSGRYHVLPDDEAARLAEIQRLRPGVDIGRIQTALPEMQALSRRQADDALRSGAIGVPMDLEKADKYIPRAFHLEDAITPTGPKPAGGANFTKTRTLQTPQEIADLGNAGKGAQFETNAKKLMMDRAVGQRRLLQKAEVGEGLLKNVQPQQSWGQLSQDELYDRALSELAKTSPDSAARLHTALRGMDPRGDALHVLSKVNRVIKPMLVAGVIIPKVGSIIRNQVGMPMQILAQEGGKLSEAAKAANPVEIGKSFVQALDGAYSKIWGKKILPADRLGRHIDDIESALRESKGSVDEARRLLRAKPQGQYLEEALNNGILDGYISSEELLKKAGAKGIKKAAMDLMDAPSEVFSLVEQRGRLSYFLSQRLRHVPVEKAAAQTQDSFYRYAVSSTGNRTMRDIIPFGQFAAQAIPQSAKFLSRNPAVAVGLRPFFEQDEANPVAPWLADQSHINFGKSDNGNNTILSGFNTPLEALNMIPLSAADVNRKIVGATQPLLKTAYSAVSGYDPTFGTPFGSYAKNPLTGENSEVGRAYQIAAGTGLLAPVTGLIGQYKTATNEKVSPGLRAADLLTGAKVVESDPDAAFRQILDEKLRGDPRAQRAVSYYQRPGEEDPEITEMIHGLADARRRARAKREAAGAL